MLKNPREQLTLFSCLYPEFITSYLSNVRHYFLVSECLEPSKVAATRTKKEAKGPLPHSWAKVCSSRLRATLISAYMLYSNLVVQYHYGQNCQILTKNDHAWEILKYILATVQWCVARRGGLHDPKMYRPFTFPCNFFSRLLLRSVWSGLQIWSGWLVLIPWLIL